LQVNDYQVQHIRRNTLALHVLALFKINRNNTDINQQ